MGQENHTFSPLPLGAHIISEKDGDRIAEWNGITLVDTSKEKQLQQPVPTIEEAMRVIRNALPKIVRPPADDHTREVAPSQPQLDPTRLIPGSNIKKTEVFLIIPT